LPNGEVKFTDNGNSDKALDFDRNLLAMFLGGNELLRTQVYVHLDSADLQGQWIVRDEPAFFL
jgi:hypothetical protein